MKRFATIALASLSLLLAHALSGLADTYYPYQSYDEYHRKHTSPGPPESPPPAPAQPETPIRPPLRAEQPITLTDAPEFLFPPQLGFGVAVGVPYDMFYLSDGYYFLKGGTWYRSRSYQGPWQVQGFSRVPAELRKYDLRTIHALRNSEFADFWKNRDHYRGRYFRPDGEPKAPPRAPRQKSR